MGPVSSCDKDTSHVGFRLTQWLPFNLVTSLEASSPAIVTVWGPGVGTPAREPGSCGTRPLGSTRHRGSLSPPGTRCASGCGARAPGCSPAFWPFLPSPSSDLPLGLVSACCPSQVISPSLTALSHPYTPDPQVRASCADASLELWTFTGSCLDSSTRTWGSCLVSAPFQGVTDPAEGSHGVLCCGGLGPPPAGQSWLSAFSMLASTPSYVT